MKRMVSLKHQFLASSIKATGRPQWMTRLDRFFLARVSGTMVRILISLVLLTAIVDLLLARQDNIVKYSIPLWAVVTYYVTLTPTILFEYHAAAISVLLAGLFVLGRAAQDNEFTALHSGGVSLLRAARAPLTGALLFAVAIFAFQETIGVRAARTFEDISQRYFSKMSGGVGKGFSRVDLDGWTLHVLSFNRRALSGQDVFLHRSDAEALEEIRARRIFWDTEKSRWVLEDGLASRYLTRENWRSVIRRITQETAPFSTPPDVLFALDAPPITRTAAQLHADILAAEARGIPTRTERMALQLKFAQPALCLVMMWLALPFAVRLRRSGLLASLGAGGAIGLAYLACFYAFTGLGYIGKVPPFVAAWTPTLLFLGAAILLTRKAPT